MLDCNRKSFKNFTMSINVRIALLFLCLAAATTHAKDVGAVYVKNSGKDVVHLWVNGSYQGYLRPGETRYSVSDGFITNDSDRPTSSGGRTAVKESHGGWENKKSDSIELTFQYPGDKRQTNKFSANGGKDLVVGVNESTSNNSPQPPSAIEVENAPAIIKGNLQNLSGGKVDQEVKANDKSLVRFAGTYSFGEQVNDWFTTTTVTIRTDGTGEMRWVTTGAGNTNVGGKLINGTAKENVKFQTQSNDAVAMEFLGRGFENVALEANLAKQYYKGTVTYRLRGGNLVDGIGNVYKKQ